MSPGERPRELATNNRLSNRWGPSQGLFMDAADLKAAGALLGALA